jgi:hypothetical protein
MAYYQKGLDGAGTEEEPFLVRSYSDYISIDARYGVADDPPYYKLMNNLNMAAYGGYMKEKDFFNGHLNMNDHSIISPKVAVGRYLIKNCDIYSNEMESVGGNGKVNVKGGCGQILDIRGGLMDYIFNACTFRRMLIDINAEGMYIGNVSPQTGLISRARGEQSHFKITNVGYIYKLITSHYMSEGYPFVDCCFEFNGEVYDLHSDALIDFGYSDPNPTDPMLNRCLIAGKVNCENLTYAYGSCPYPLIKGKVSDSAFYLYGYDERDQKGYGGYADTIDNGSVTIALDISDSKMYIKNQNGVTMVSAQNYINPTYLKSIDFDVININKEG